MTIAGAAIGAAGSLLGGIFGRSDPKYVVPNYAKIREKAEAAGFNPLTALTSAPGAVVQSQSYMGSAISDAAMYLADGVAKSAEAKGEAQRLREENAALQERVQSLTIRPKVDGIYADNERTPLVRQGGSDASVRSSDFGLGRHVPDLPFLVDTDRGPLTLGQYASARDVPAFRAFGHDFYGSGNFSTAAQVEDSLGDVASWGWGALAGVDAVGNELREYRMDRQAKGGPVYRMEDGQYYALQPPKREPFWKKKPSSGSASRRDTRY